jgi:hypothetical protein
MDAMCAFELKRPASVAEASALLATSGARVIAGGSDLVPNLRRDVAGVAATLLAIAVRRAPPFALVVEHAARVEAQVAAQRAGVAVRRRGDFGRRLRERGIFTRNA